MTQEIGLSIVLPVFNEAQSLPILWEELQAVLKTVEETAEVIFVDDGSTDSSVEFVRLLQATDARVRLIRLAANRGLSSALAAGLRTVRGRIVVTLDSDLQSDPADIPLLLAQLDRPGVEQILAGTANGAVIMSRKSWTGLQPKAHPSRRIVPTRRIGNDDMLVPGGGA